MFLKYIVSKNTHTHARARAHTHIHACTHTHTHACMHAASWTESCEACLPARKLKGRNDEQTEVQAGTIMAFLYLLYACVCVYIYIYTHDTTPYQVACFEIL